MTVGGGLIRPAGVVRTVVAHQEGGDAQGTGFDFGRELQLDYRGLAAAAGGDGRRRLVDALANGASELPGQEGGDRAVVLAGGTDGVQRFRD